MDLSKLISSAGSENAESQYELGNIYFFDWMANIYGVKLNHKIASKWYKKAADHGHPGAQCQLAYLYLHSSDKDKWQLAGDLLTKAARQGDVSAMANLGRIFASAKGVPYMSDVAEGWLTEAAEKGDGEDKYCLGLFYHYGVMSLEQNYQKAAHWYQQSAHCHHPEALRRLVQLYEKGFGVPKDFLKADACRERVEDIEKERAKREGSEENKRSITYPDYLRTLARLYRHGLLCDKNEDRARILLEEAFGEEEVGNLDPMENRMRMKLEGLAYSEWIELHKKPKQFP